MAGGIASAIVSLSWLIGQRKPTRAKMSPYECGMAPVGDARQRFSVKFYLVAMLFILFDVEAVFIYPWAIILRDLKKFGLWEMLVYIGIFLVGFFYVWKKGVLGLGRNRRRDGEISECRWLPPSPILKQLKNHPARGAPAGLECRRRHGREVRSRRDDDLCGSRSHPRSLRRSERRCGAARSTFFPM